MRARVRVRVRARVWVRVRMRARGRGRGLGADLSGESGGGVEAGEVPIEAGKEGGPIVAARRAAQVGDAKLG